MSDPDACGDFATIDIQMWKPQDSKPYISWQTHFRDKIMRNYIAEITGYPANFHHNYKVDIFQFAT